MKKENKGITLIALVITIIIMLILAGVVLNLAIGERGIFKTAQNAGKNYTEVQNNELLALNYIDTQINNTINTNDAPTKKITSFEEMLTNNGISNTYTKLEFANNKDYILNKVLKNNSSIDYIINNSAEYIDLLTKSQVAMECMGNSKGMGDEAIGNETWRTAILDSQYLSDFNKGAKKVPVMTSNTEPEGEAFISAVDDDAPVFYCFDGDNSTESSISRPYTKDGYIGYKFNEKVMPYYIEILNNHSYDNYLSFIKIQGSNDGIAYTDLTDVKKIPPSGWSFIKLISEASYEKYQYLRIVQTVDKGSAYYAGAYTIQFYGR